MDRVASGQRLGQRDVQEDALLVSPETPDAPDAELFLLLADGMGGHAGGEVASGLAIEAFAEHFQHVSTNMRPRGRLSESVGAANDALAARIAAEPELEGMGCTLIGALIVEQRLIWTSVGDSLLLLLRGGTLRRLNADHSYMSELRKLVDAGQLTEEEARHHPQRHVLMSALMGEQVHHVDVGAIPLEPGDVVLLASDGLETLTDGEIARIAAARIDEGGRAIADALLNAVDARRKPRQDNTTVIAVRQPGPARRPSAPALAPSRAGVASLPSLSLPWLIAGVGAAALTLGLGIGALLGGDTADPDPAPARQALGADREGARVSDAFQPRIRDDGPPSVDPESAAPPAEDGGIRESGPSGAPMPDAPGAEGTDDAPATPPAAPGAANTRGR